MQKKLSIVVPIYQNEYNIKHTVPKLLEVAKGISELHNLKIELIFVDDGSSDNSFIFLLSYYHLNNEFIKIIKLSKNFGQQYAIQAGIRHSTGDCVGIISADLQEPPELFYEMIKLWFDGHKYILAERDDREESILHVFISGLYWKAINKFGMNNFPKGGYDFCLIDRQVANLVNDVREKNTSIFALLFWFGFNPKILSYKRKIRAHGNTTWTFLKKVKLTIDTIIGFTYLPTRFLSLSAMITSLLTFLYSLYVFFIWVFQKGEAPDGWTTLALLVLLIGGLILFGLGIIGEYLLRILEEVRGRPEFVVDEIIQPISKENNTNIID